MKELLPMLRHPGNGGVHDLMAHPPFPRDDSFQQLEPIRFGECPGNGHRQLVVDTGVVFCGHRRHAPQRRGLRIGPEVVADDEVLRQGPIGETRVRAVGAVAEGVRDQMFPIQGLQQRQLPFRGLRGRRFIEPGENEQSFHLGALMRRPRPEQPPPESPTTPTSSPSPVAVVIDSST